MATLYDVCEKTGFSTATVSRVINNSGLVKEETRARVLQAMAELNYHPSVAARMLAGGKTNTIGVVLPAIDNGYYVQVLHGLDQVTTKENLKLLIFFYHSVADLSEALNSLSGEGRTDAIIVMNNMFLPPEKLRELSGNDVPIVLIGQNHGTTKCTDSVIIDNFQGAYLAVKHLLERQPKSILLITGPENNHDSQERLRGARKALEEAADPLDVSILSGDFYQKVARGAFEAHIKKQSAYPDAVFAFNDDMALGVLEVLEGTPKRVPEDIHVIGFDNNAIAQFIGLSTISVPMQQIGSEAGRLAAERIKDKDAEPTTITMGTTLISRKTTD